MLDSNIFIYSLTVRESIIGHELVGSVSIHLENMENKVGMVSVMIIIS